MLHSQRDLATLHASTRGWRIYVSKTIQKGKLRNTKVSHLGVSTGEAWLARLRAEGVEADEATWASVINAYATARDAAGAERAFSRAQAALVGLGGRGAGLSCSPVLYRTVAKAFAKSRDVAGTERWILEMSDRGLEPGLEGYSTILRACGAEGQLQRLHCRTGEDAIHDSNILARLTFSSVLVGLADGGRGQEAASWL
ncbi:unnamed protein product, partial [Polarella glacialis]